MREPALRRRAGWTRCANRLCEGGRATVLQTYERKAALKWRAKPLLQEETQKFAPRWRRATLLQKVRGRGCVQKRHCLPFKGCCFDTGLLSRAQLEPVYMQFCVNRNSQVDCYWYFSKFFRRGESDVRRYASLPDMAFYWEEPSKLIFDSRKELIVNVEHIILDNRNRFPEPYSGQTAYQLQIAINGSIEAAKERLRQNYKIAVPQYFITAGTIQLLIPLCLAKPNVADLALVAEDYGTLYRASTCLTLDQAINNARLLARPDRDWLNP